MKEIDFIPEWYKANQKRRRRFHRQYVLLGVLVALLMIWSFVVGEYVEGVNAEVQDVQQIVENGKVQVDEGLQLEIEIAGLKSKADVLEKVTPRTNVSAIIGELSYLIRNNIILTRLSVNNEVIDIAEENKKAASAVVVNISPATGKADEVNGLLRPTRTEITLIGLAAQPADAAKLISELEQSNYFEQETLVYSKPSKIRDYDVTEFEIRCYVADYELRQ